MSDGADAAAGLRSERTADGIATLTLDRPAKRNALSVGLRRAFADAANAFAADPAVRVLVVTGSGGSFTAGLDLDEWESAGAPAAAAYVHDPVAALLAFPGPVIGAIDGACITGGLELALACDLLVASTAARFADTHAKAGLLPGWGGSVRLAARIGPARAKALAFTGRFIGADEALAWGLVDRVVAPERLGAEAEALAREMLAADPATLIAYKRLLDAGSTMTFADAIRHEREASVRHNGGVPKAAIDARLRISRRR